MSKAELRALEAYPPKYVEQKRHPKRIQSEKTDVHQPIRTVYIKGYQQAEKNLELTWEDMRELYIIFAEVDTEIELYKTDIKSETIGYYEEVLNRFNKQKER